MKMSICITNCCRIALNLKAKPKFDVLPRCFSSRYKDTVEVFKTFTHSDKRISKDRRMMEEQYNKLEGQKRNRIVTHKNVCKLLKIGTSVVRGPDWKWQVQDWQYNETGGFMAGKGVIISKLREDGWIRVQWKDGDINSYRMGRDHKYDLKISQYQPQFETNANNKVQETPIDDSTYDSNILDDLLPMYYKSLFPYDLFYKWLSYGQPASEVYRYREFAFEITADIFYRYKSFDDSDQFKFTLMRKCPRKIHLGPMYSDSPKYKKWVELCPDSRELTFDIDMTDYNDVRNCCKKSDICNKCWKFIAVAVKILERAMREDYGFKHIMWVFSGRRGVHCWVCDAKALKLSEFERAAIVNDLMDMSIPNNSGREFPPSDSAIQHIEKSLEICSRYIETIIVEQDLLATSESHEIILQNVTDENLKTTLRDILNKYETTLEKWRAIHAELLKMQNIETEASRGSISPLNKIILDLVYPRMDTNVTIAINHLLKAPFSVHSATGRVSIPFPAGDVDSFDPTKVRNLSELDVEIEKYDRNNGENDVPDYMKTSLKESYAYFEKFTSSLYE